MILLLMKLEGKDLNFESQFIISDVLKNLVLSRFNPFIEFSNEFFIAELNKRLKKIKCLSIFDPNMKIFWKENFFSYINFSFLDNSPN